MKIGTVAIELGIPASTIRYYERIGLTAPPARVAGQREYDQRSILELKFVRLAQTAGFSIKEIRALSTAQHADKSSNPWQPFVEKKLDVIREKINGLHKMESILSTLQSCECSSLSKCTETASASHGLCQLQPDES